jgi:hypothetical protein
VKEMVRLPFRSAVPGEFSVMLNFFGAPDREFGVYARAYHDAARKLADKRLRSLDVLPIVYLYRQALELYMKAIILEGNRVVHLKGFGRPDDEVWKLLDARHQLTKLLPPVIEVFKHLGWEWWWNDPAIDSFGSLEQTLRSIEEIDRHSFAFRYPTNKKGLGSVRECFEFSPSAFVSAIDPVAEAFDTVVIALDSEYDQAC